MSVLEIEAGEGGVPSTTLPYSSSTSTNTSIDIGVFVDRYNRLQELVYPFRLLGRVVFYVIRWENYILTLAILLCLCVLFYYPAFLAGFLVVMAIAGMAVGKYYSQTKINTLHRKKEMPHVEYLDEDKQAMKRFKREEKAAHKLLLEYKQIIYSAEAHMVLATQILEYLYRIVLWKSLEVSLCVTVLLCMLLALLCTVYLRVLSASLPLLVLCFNKHFLNRTVELWKGMFRYAYMKVRLKTKASKKESRKAGGAELRGSPHQPSDAVHHHSDHSPTNQAPSTELTTASGSNVGSNHGSDSDEGRGAARCTTRQRSVTLPVVGASADGNGVGWARESANHTYSKGFCNKCNTSFAKLLKRKHDCNYCGQSYCGSCTAKVKRAELGATSPAAFEESVRVCLDCKQRLADLKLSENSINPS